MFFSDLTNRIAGQGADAFRVADRAAEMAARGADVISLALGDPDFETPEPIVEAAVRALRTGRTHYLPSNGDEALRKLVAQSQSEVDGIAWGPDNVVIFQGAQSALFSTMLCVAEAGRSVVTFDPLYATYEAVIGASGARLVRIPVDIPYDGRTAEPRIDVDQLTRLIPTDASAVLLNCPNNPGGYVLGKETLEAIASICIERDVWLVTDEVYRELIFEGTYASPSGMPGMAERTVVVNSLSKSHAMTGWRIGWAIARREMADHLTRVAQCSLFGAPPFIQDAAIEALKHSSQCVAEFRGRFMSRRDALLGALSTSSVLRTSAPVGGMFALIDISGTGLTSEAFADRALDEYGVAVVPGTAFSAAGDSFIRVSFARSKDEVAEGARRLATFASQVVSEMAAKVPSSSPGRDGFAVEAAHAELR